MRPKVVGEFLRKYDGAALPSDAIAKSVLLEKGVPTDRLHGVLDLIIESAKAIGFIREWGGKRYVDLAGPAGNDDAAEQASALDGRENPGPSPAILSSSTVAPPSVSVGAGVHVNIEIHIAADASSVTIEEIFRNMRRYVLSGDGLSDANPQPADSPDPDLLRRLREFQLRVRKPPRKTEAVIPSRAPLTGRDADILLRLRHHSPSLADSLEQALKDLNDHTRLTYLGPAGEIREVMRSTVQLFAG